jgi:hypothetical protein
VLFKKQNIKIVRNDFNVYNGWLLPESSYNVEETMPEIRATLTEELHRQLKSEAAQEGKHLKELIAQVLEKHAAGRGDGRGKKHK